MKTSTVKILLHLEGLALLVAACVVFQKLGASWLEFGLLFLAPDISIAGYLLGKKSGALLYNSAHTYLAPFVLGAIADLISFPSLWPIAVIWVAHIGFDRLLGYGLKYETDFKDTHLARV